jgi:membrane-associated protein
MSFSISDTFLILEHYKYLVIFPVVILEGPIITIISGFLVYLGHLNIYIAFLMLVVGDLLGDALHYWIGKYWQKFSWVNKIGYFLGYTESSKVLVNNHFKKHAIKTLIFAKFSHGVGTVIQIAAGIALVDFSKYILVNFFVTLLKTAILLFIGYYVGSSYLKIDGYLNTIAFSTISITLFIFLYFLLSKYIKSYFIKSSGLE